MKPKYSLVRVRATRRFFIPTILATALALAFGVKTSHAQTNGTWDGGGGSAIWGGSANWAPDNQIATGAGATATFGTGFTSGTDIQVNTARTIGNINHNSTTTDITISQINSSVFTLDVTTGSPTITVGTAARILTITAPISGNDGMTKAGAGTLVLSGANPFTGSAIVSAGTLRATSNAGALGAGSLSLGAGTLQLANNTGLNFARNTTVTATTTIVSDRLAAAEADTIHTLGTLSIGAQTLNVSRGANITGAGVGGVTFGAATLTGASTISPGADSLLRFSSTTGLDVNTLTKAGAGQLTLTGVVSGTKALGTVALQINAGTVAVTSNSNTFTGNIAVAGAGAFFEVATGAAYTTVAPWGRVLNSGTAANTKQILLTNGGGFRVASGSLNVNNTTAANYGAGIIFNIGTGGGVLDVASGATLIIDDGNTTGTGLGAAQIQGAGSITKTGLGILQIDDSTAYAGNIIVNEGLLRPASGNAFGTAAGNTTINTGAALNVQGIGMTNQEPLNITGTGLASSPQGALTNSTGSGTWAGPITLGGDATIGSVGVGFTLGSTATINAGTNTLTMTNSGSGNFVANGIISGGVGGNVVVTGTGQYVVNAQSTYSGGTTLSAGTNTIPQVSSTGAPGSVTSGPYGTGTITAVPTAQIRASVGLANIINNDVILNGGITFLTAATENSFTFGGPVTLSGGNAVITSTVGNSVAGKSAIINGAIGDGGNNYSLTKLGTGNLILGGANTYGGDTIVNAGVLVLSGSIPTNKVLTVSPTVASGAGFALASDTANPLTNVSALTIGSVAGPTAIGLDLGANTAASDAINTPNPAITAGAVNIGIMPLAGFGSASTYNLITAPSGLSGATYTLTNVPGGFTYALSASDTLVQLSTSPIAVGNLYWRGNTSSSWSSLISGNTNWFTDAAGSTNAQANPGAGNTVNFSATTANSSFGVITTTLDNNYTVRNLLFGSNPNGVTAVTVAPGVTPAALPGVLAVAPVSAADGISVGSNAGNVTISAPVILGTNQTWSVDGTGANGSSLTVSGPISGTSALSISGLVTLSAPAASSNYSGATAVPNGSILQGGATNSFSANTAVTVSGTGTVRLNGFSNTIASLAGNGTVQNNSAATGATLTTGNANDSSFSGTLQNGAAAALGLTKAGTGKLTLTGVNTHTGTTTVNDGTLVMGSASALSGTPAMTLAGNGVFDLNGFSPTVGALSSAVSTSSIINSGTGVGTDTFSFTAAGVVSALITSGVSPRVTALRVTNANGNFLLTNGANTFSGGIVLTNSVGGTRMSPGTITAGSYGTGPITIGESPTDLAGIFFATATQIFTNPIIVNTALGTDRAGIRSDALGIELSGQITANLASVTFSTNGNGAISLTGKVTGSQGLILDSATSGAGITITLNNAAANNDYAGDTVIGQTATAGRNRTLQIAAADQIPNGAGKGNVIVNSNGTGIGLLSLAAVSETINGLSGNGNVASTSGIVTLTLGDNNANGSHSGAINNTADTLSLTKIGSGTQTLSGVSNFAGALTVNGGLVAFPSSPVSAGPLGNSTVVNLNGGGISYTSSGANNLNRPLAIGASAGTVNVDHPLGVLTFQATSTGGNLIKTGTGTAVMSGSTSLSAGAVVNGGTLQAGFGGSDVATITVGAAGNLDLRDSAAEILTLANTAGALTLSGGAQLGFELDGASSDRIDLGATGTAVTSGVVTLNLFNTGAGVAVGTYNLISSTSGGLAAANYVLGTAPSGFNYTINKTNNLVSLTVSAQMPIFWRGGQNFSWNTLGSGPANWTTDAAGSSDALSKPVLANTVNFGAVGAPFSSGTFIDTTLDAAFTVDSLQFSNAPTGITAVSIAAGTGGSLTLAPASSISGIRVLPNAGVITIAAPLTIGAAQTWDVDPSGSLIVSGNTTFTNSVNKTNTGALTLSGANTGAGSITLSAGTLNLDSATALGNGTFTIGAGTTINATAAPIALSTSNNQNWLGDFTFTGTNDLSLGTGAVTMGSSLAVTTSGSTLSVGGAIGDGGNNRGLTKAGAGTMVLTGANTYGGLTNLSAGVLRITNATGLGSVSSGTIQSGSSALELDGTSGAFTVGAEALTINGGGVTLPVPNLGALRNIVGDNTYGGTITMAGQSRINSDSGTLTLNNPTAVSSAGLTLVIGGTGNITVNGSLALGAGGLIKDGSGKLVLAGTNAYTGTTLVSAGIVDITGSTTGTGNVTVGNVASTNAVLNVHASGSLVGTPVAQSPTITLGTGGSGSVGVLNMTGGIVTLQGTDNSTDGIAFGASNDGFGGYFMNGGIFTQQRFMFGGTGSTTGTGGIGVGLQTGGTVNASGWMILARAGASTGVYSITGGTLNRAGASNDLALGLGGSGRAELNVVGGMIDNTGRRVCISGGTGGTFSWTGTGVLNLNSGTLLTNAIFYSSGTGYVNFNGGTLRAAANNTNFINALTAGGAYVNGAFGTFAGGAVIDTNGFSTTMASALLAPFGDGVATIPLINGGGGYVAAPHVQITGGGGFGATAYATIDTNTGVVTSIVITNPGIGYTFAPTVTLMGGGGSGATVDVATLAPAASGGLTKTGAGVLTLSGANTYTGSTLVSAGTLLLNGSAANFPTTSGITIDSSGTLAFTAGAASTLDLAGRSLTLSGGALNFDIGAPGIHDAIQVDNFTLTANSAFTFNSLGGLAEGGSYTLLTSANPIVNSGPFTLAPQTIGRVTLTPTINANTITVGTTIDESQWGVNSSGNWSTVGNWTGYVPEISGDAALFGSVITAPQTVTVDVPHSVGFIRFNNANAYTIGTNGSSFLTLNNGANSAAITVTSGSHTIAENVALASNLNVLPATGTTLTMSGVINGLTRSFTMNGAGTTLLSGANTYTGTTTVTAGRLNVTGAINQGTTATDVIVANTAAGNAVLNIAGGSITSRYLTVGTVTGAAGAVHMSSGTFTTGSDNELTFTFGAGGATGGYGYFGMSGGTVNTSRFQFGGQNIVSQNGVGVGLLSGGTVNASSYIILARYGTSAGTVGSLTIAPGATVNHTAATNGWNIGLGWQGAGRAELSLTGGDLTSTTGRVVGYGAGGSAWTGTGVINLNAGTLTTTAFTVAGTGATSYLNFNGGTLKGVSTQATFLPAVTGAYVNGAFGGFTGGATFDTNGVDLTVVAPLLAPIGDGVATIPVTAGGSGYIGAPYVSITDSGAGFGATAIANMVDDGSGNGTFTISSITITNPGNDYTAPSVSITGGGNGVTDATIGTPTIAANTSGGLTKNSLGNLSLSGFNTYTGVTTINGGTLTINEGSIASSSNIVNNGTLAYALSTNARAYANVISGNGSLVKSGTNILTLSGANTYSGINSITGGTLQISAANNLGDGSVTNAISMAGGTLRSTGGSYSLGVNRAITMTGAAAIQADADTLTVDGNIANGANLLTLRGNGNILVTAVIGTGATPTGGLNIGVNAAGGGANVTLTGNNLFTGNVSLPAANTVPKATLTLTNSGALGVGPKTIGAAGGGEIYLQNNITIASNINWSVSGLTAIWNASGNNTIQGNITITSGNGDTALNSVSGFLTVTGNMSANQPIRQLRLRGDGNGLISGVIANGTTVNMPVLKDSGTGTWTLSGVNTYTGNSSVTVGTLLITGSVAGTATAATSGVLGGTGTVTGAATIATTGVVSPGVNNVGIFNFSSTLTMDAGSNYAVSITGNGVNDKVNVTGALTANGNITVTLESYTPVINDTFDLADAASITGTPTFTLPALSGGLVWDTSTFATNGQIKVTTADPYTGWASGFGLTGGDALKSADPDGDGMNNLLEFATNSNPTSGGSGARTYGKIHMIGGNPVLTYTVATRAVATFAANGSTQEATKDLVKYTIEGSNDLSIWNTVVVTEVTGGDATAVQAAIVPALPTLDTGWEWHTFRTDDNTATDASDFIRLKVAEAP